VVGHLDQVDVGESARDEDRIDSVLRVPGEQEPLSAERAEQHDRDVVDAGPRVGRGARHGDPVRPEDVERDVVEGEPIAGRQDVAVQAPPGQGGLERGIAGTGAGHSRVHEPPDPVTLDQQRETGDVVFVRVREHDEVDPAVPWRDPRVEGHEEPIRVRSAVHEQPATPRGLDKDRVALADVERDDVEAAVRAGRRRHGHRGDSERQDDRKGPDYTVRAQRRSAGAARPRRGRAACSGTRSSRRARRPAHPGQPRPEDSGDAPPAGGDHEQGGGQPAERRAGRRREGDASEREIRGRLHDRDEQADDDGTGQPEQRRRDGGGASTHKEAADHPERPGCHCQGHEWHDDEVEDRRQGGEPTERQEDDRERRHLRRERDGQPLDDEARQKR
jgi:hypothetical protein